MRPSSSNIAHRICRACASQSPTLTRSRASPSRRRWYGTRASSAPPPAPAPPGTTNGHHQQQQQEQQQHSGDVGAEMRRRCPYKIIPDYLTPLPSYQLSTLLDDLFSQDGVSSPTTTPSDRSLGLKMTSPTIQKPPSVLPLGAHLVYFPPLASGSRLSPDGADADHVPPSFRLAPYQSSSSNSKGGGRRLWAGGEVSFRDAWHDHLRLDGRAWTCREEIGNVVDRSGKVFVDVWRKYGLGHHANGPMSDKESLITERRTLVFVPESEDDATMSSPPRVIRSPFTPTWSFTATPSPTHLFHFSALTYNAHFIHLQPPPSALVHGPLLLALMLRALDGAGVGGAVRSISYRNLAPLRVNDPLRVCIRAPPTGLADKTAACDVWVEGPEGGMAVRGKADVDGL